MVGNMMNKNRKFIIKTLLSSLIRRRSRILVALLGTVIGSAVLLGMITLCFDIPRQMGKEFRSYGANMIFMPAGIESTMSLNEINKAKALINNEQLIGLTLFRYTSARSNLQPYTLVGTNFEQVQKTSPYWLIEGNYPTKDNEIMVGIDIAHFADIKIGDVVPLSGKSKQDSLFEEEFNVSGIVKTGKSEDGFVYINYNKLESLLEEDGQVNVAELSISATQNELERDIQQIKDNVPTIAPHLVKWVTKSETAVLGKLTALLYLVTSVVLILTMICVATTMMTVVMERRKEIGLKKALGAENNKIAKEFLAESVMLGLIGGLIGAMFGLLFAQVISSQVFARSIVVEFYLIPVTVMISIIVTVIACLIPVKRAVEVEPALVLRGE
ncbi:FtsX-like permease family protein [Orbaceae bacterium ac157xtp]